MTKYNWGIIGNGWIAHDMADALNAVNGEIYAVSGVNENALREFAKEKHVQHVYTDPDKMIADPNIDIVYIATPHTFHYEYIKKALNAGKLGQIKMIQVNFGSLKDYDPKNRFFNKDLAGGASLDIGGYATAFARTFLDESPESILTTVKFFEIGVD